MYSKLPKKFSKEDVDKTLDLVRKKLLGEKLENLTDQQQQSVDTVAELVGRHMTNMKALDRYNDWVKTLRSQSKVTENPVEQE